MKRICAILFIAALSLAQSGNKGGIDRSTLDTSCKPCDDFFRYANGGWLDKNPIPADRANIGAFSVLGDANRERLKSILDTVSSNPSATGDEKRVGDFYASCMDTETIEKAGAKPLEQPFARIAAIQSRKDLGAFFVAVEQDSRRLPFALAADTDPDNASRMIAWISAGGLSLPDRDYYFRTDTRSKTIRDEFVKHVAATLVLAGEKQPDSDADAKAILDFETVLANARLTAAARRDPAQIIHKMDFAQVEELAPAFDWKGYFKVLNVSTAGPINVSEPEFVKTVNRQLQEAPVETWKAWLRWRVANGRSRGMSKAFFDEYFHFNQTVLSGVQQQRPRWETCVGDTDSTLGEALGRLYAEKYFPADSKRRVEQLVANMREALGDTLRTADWLGQETRQNALRKLDAFDPLIGYPSKWRDYSKVQVARDGYSNNKESASIEDLRFNLAKIGKGVDRTEWSMTPPTVNAYYSPDRNQIVFPAGILQYPFFEPDADDAVNYGGIGAVIGHEMGHGFDDEGSKFDAEGNVKNWWTDQDQAKFETRASCVTQQFDGIDVGDGQHHNGKLVTGEAMGDLGGLTLAYKAYHQSLQGKEAPVIDGFTGDQRFFLAFARVWARNDRPEAARRQMASDPHPLAKYRVNATVANMPEFHAAFSCKRGDAMVRPPEERCKLW